MAEVVQRLGMEADHVIFGHTHRAGPLPGRESGWRLPGGGRLCNTGSWTTSASSWATAAATNPYWPGSVAWIGDDGPPRAREPAAGCGASAGAGPLSARRALAVVAPKRPPRRRTVPALVLRGRRRARLARPLLVELDAPLAVLVLLELELGPEAAARAAAEARDLLLGAADAAGRRRARIEALSDSISSFTTAAGSDLPAFLFQITNPQPGSSFDQHE